MSDYISSSAARYAEAVTPRRPSAQPAQLVHSPDRTATLNEKKNGKHKQSRQEWRRLSNHTNDDYFDSIPSFERMR